MGVVVLYEKGAGSTLQYCMREGGPVLYGRGRGAPAVCEENNLNPNNLGPLSMVGLTCPPHCPSCILLCTYTVL